MDVYNWFAYCLLTCFTFVQLDFGVNAKRINYIAKALKAKGWDAPGVEIATHMGYAEENNVKSF